MSVVSPFVRLASRAPAGTSLDQLVSGLKAREPWASVTLTTAYGAYVRRLLTRVLGINDVELRDLVQDVFAAVWEGIGRLEDPRAFERWLTQITVFTGRQAIRRRRRRRWLTFLAEPPETETASASPAIREAVRCVYKIFERMPEDERIPYALRRLDGMELGELAAACGMSVATARRRLASAEKRFLKLAQRYECLADWIDE